MEQRKLSDQANTLVDLSKVSVIQGRPGPHSQSTVQDQEDKSSLYLNV